jgi:hypothetical protein
MLNRLRESKECEHWLGPVTADRNRHRGIEPAERRHSTQMKKLTEWSVDAIPVDVR